MVRYLNIDVAIFIKRNLNLCVMIAIYLKFVTHMRRAFDDYPRYQTRFKSTVSPFYCNHNLCYFLFSFISKHVMFFVDVKTDYSILESIPSIGSFQ